MTHKVTMIRRCFVAGRLRQVGETVTVDDEALHSLEASRRCMPTAETAGVGERLDEPKVELEKPKRKRGRPAKSKDS